jgi:hypothetical protein
MGKFVATMLASFPSEMTVPDPLKQYFAWIEAQGLDRNFDGEGYKYAIIDPAAEESCLGLEPVDPDYGKYWLGGSQPADQQRLAPFCRTGGDGSRAALWLDDAGETQFVHLGSGSGSVMVGIMVPNAVDFLRVLAIGYDELCWGQQYGMTPDEIFLAEHPDIDDYDEDELEHVRRPVEHSALRQWVIETFGGDIPKTADAIIPALPSMDADHSDDPFWKWIRSFEQ